MPHKSRRYPMRKRTLLTVLSLLALAAVVAATATAAANGRASKRCLSSAGLGG